MIKRWGDGAIWRSTNYTEQRSFPDETIGEMHVRGAGVIFGDGGGSS